MAKKDVNIKVTADTREAVRSLREAERQVDKLGDMADQGERRQDGFLSPRQVQVYKRILRELEQAHATHQRKLADMEETYDRKKESKEHKKLKDLEEQVRKRQQALRNAEGGNRWGDQANPVVQEYHRTKLDQAQETLKAYKGSDELKKAMADVSQLEADLNVMRATVQRIEDERNRGQGHADRINNMHQMDPGMRRMVHGAAGAIGATGAIAGFSSYWNYTTSGIDLLRQQEKATNSVALQGGYKVGGQVDGELRRSNYYKGEEQYYDTLDTAVHQKAIISGGTTGNLKALDKDTKAVQRFGRAYAIDPTEVANGGAMLQRMGTIKEGEQQRFANLIAGAISKNGMSGRQEEMLRATVSLAQSVSQGQAQFSQQQFKNTMGLQVAMGEAVPELKGERGANLLSTMDGAIKGGGHQLDLLMGKGTEFVGLEGMTKLEQLKEQGLSNPENLQRVLKGADRMFGGNENMTKWALKEQLGLQMNEYDALKKSGFIDKIKKDPNSVSSVDLEKIGAKELSKQWNTYQNSETAQVDKADSRGRNLKGSHAQVADEAAKLGRNTLWHDMPNWLQHTLLPLAGVGVGGAMTVGGGALRRRITNGISRMLNPTIGGQGGMLSRVGGMLGSAASWTRNLFTGGGAGGGGGSLLSRAGGLLKAGGKLLGPVGELAGLDYLDKKTDQFGDWVFGHEKGQKKLKSGIFHNPFSSPYEGEYEDDKQGAISKAWDWITGGGDSASDKKTKKVPTTNSTAKADAKVNTISADKLNINSKELANYFGKESSKKDTTVASGGKSKEQVIRIMLEGDIKGMDKKNQDKVASSVENYFTNAFSYANNPFKVNLGLDQNRG